MADFPTSMEEQHHQHEHNLQQQDAAAAAAHANGNVNPEEELANMNPIEKAARLDLAKAIGKQEQQREFDPKPLTTSKRKAENYIHLYAIKRGSFQARLSCGTWDKFTLFTFFYDYPKMSIATLAAKIPVNAANHFMLQVQLKRHRAILVEAGATQQVNMTQFMSRVLFDLIAESSAKLKAKFSIKDTETAPPPIVPIANVDDDGQQDHDDDGGGGGPPPVKLQAGADRSISAAKQRSRQAKKASARNAIVQAFTMEDEYKTDKISELFQKYDCLMEDEIRDHLQCPASQVGFDLLLHAIHHSMKDKTRQDLESKGGFIDPEPVVDDMRTAYDSGEHWIDIIQFDPGNTNGVAPWVSKVFEQMDTYRQDDSLLAAEKKTAKDTQQLEELDADTIMRAIRAPLVGPDSVLFWRQKSKDKEFVEATKKEAALAMEQIPAQHMSKVDSSGNRELPVQYADLPISGHVKLAGAPKLSASIKWKDVGGLLMTTVGQLLDSVGGMAFADDLIDVCLLKLFPTVANAMHLSRAITDAASQLAQSAAATPTRKISVVTKKESKAQPIYVKRM